MYFCKMLPNSAPYGYIILYSYKNIWEELREEKVMDQTASQWRNCSFSIPQCLR